MIKTELIESNRLNLAKIDPVYKDFAGDCHFNKVEPNYFTVAKPDWLKEKHVYNRKTKHFDAVPCDFKCKYICAAYYKDGSILQFGFTYMSRLSSRLNNYNPYERIGYIIAEVVE